MNTVYGVSAAMYSERKIWESMTSLGGASCGVMATPTDHLIPAAEESNNKTSIAMLQYIREAAGRTLLVSLV